MPCERERGGRPGLSSPEHDHGAGQPRPVGTEPAPPGLGGPMRLTRGVPRTRLLPLRASPRELAGGEHTRPPLGRSAALGPLCSQRSRHGFASAPPAAAPSVARQGAASLRCSPTGARGMRRLDAKSRMSREGHVRFRQGAGVRHPRTTRLDSFARRRIS